MGRLDGKVAIVTGAYQGIGEGISRVLARHGALVALTDVNQDVIKTAEKIKEEGFKAQGYQMDVTNSEEVNKVVQKVLDNNDNRIDILVNNAGISPRNFLLDITDDFLLRMFNINVFGMFRCCSAVLPTMIKQKYGKIVNMSSVTGPIDADASGGQTAYAATKAAVGGFTVALALEVAQHGINVNAICPGHVDSAGARSRISAGNSPDKSVDELGRTVPLGRMASTEEIGELALFLASDESKYLMGTRIVIDGANTLQETYRGPYSTRPVD